MGKTHYEVLSIDVTAFENADALITSAEDDVPPGQDPAFQC